MLATYESAHVLPIAVFAKLAGKSRDQINREVRAGRLLAIAIGNRGQRIPGWQLDSIKAKLTSTVLEQNANIDPWELYRVLSLPRDSLDGCSIIDAVSASNYYEMTVMTNVILRRA